MKQNRNLSLPHVNSGWRIDIVHSGYYEPEVKKLVEGAVKFLTEAGISAHNVRERRAWGSFEIPLIGAALAESKETDALIGLGIIVEGQTHHARLIAEQAARGAMDVQVRYRIPFVFEVLYVDDLALVKDRLNKGEEAAACVLNSLALLDQIRG